MIAVLIYGLTSDDFSRQGAMVVMGNLTPSLYVLLALFSNRGDWKRFQMGHRV